MNTEKFDTDATGIPILSKEQIEKLGERLVAEFNPKAIETPEEIDIDRFLTRFLGKEQDFKYLSHNGMFLGMTVFNNTDKVPVFNPALQRAEYISVKAGTVLVDNHLLTDSQEHRYRFTVGHEASHCILHTEYFDNTPQQITMFGNDYVPMIRCRVERALIGAPKHSQWTSEDRMEWQANRLSSAILMPRSMVFKVATMAEDRSYSINAAVEAISETFNVSISAAGYRMKELGIVPGTLGSTLPF